MDKRNKTIKSKGFKRGRGRPSKEEIKSRTTRLPFSDNPTLLDIQNMSGGRMGYDITTNGFVTTQGNRTFALISPHLEITRLNTPAGLPVYMGAKSVAEVEYPTADSDLKPNPGGTVFVNKVQLGRLNTLAYVSPYFSYAYQGVMAVSVPGGDGSINEIAAILPLSITAGSE